MKQSESVTLKEVGATYALTIDEARLRQAPFTIERDGKPVAAVVPVEEYQEFMAWREQTAHAVSPTKKAIPQQDAPGALQKERAAFLRLKDQLLRTHPGQFVAILNGEVIDSDQDDRALTRRVYAEHGYIPIYIDEIGKEPTITTDSVSQEGSALMPPYSTELDPPAPVLDFTVYCPVDHRRAARVRGELDSGAEISVLPQEIVDALHLIPRRLMITESYDGTQSQWATYMIDLEVEGQPVNDVEVIALPRQNGILGHDVLNHFVVTLHGKALTFEMIDP